MKVGIVYDWIHAIGGAERILQALIEIFPDALIFTSIYDKENAVWANNFKVNYSFMQQIPGAKSHHELFPFITPIAFESFDFTHFDLIISVTSADAKGIITKPDTLHICYMLTPTRYLWSHEDYYLQNSLIRVLSRPVVKYLKEWDIIASTRPDYIFAISHNVKKRIAKYYGKKVMVVYPPVNTKDMTNSKDENEDYYLMISRLVPYKKVDLIIRTFNKINKRLFIVGSGRDYNFLRSIANKNITLLGNVSEQELINYYRHCIAVIIACEEDFGLVAVEAQAFGKPVIAYSKGGIKETVIDNKTGILFDEQNIQSVTSAIEKFEKIKLLKNDMLENAKRFSKQKFINEFTNEINKCYKEYFGKR